MKVRGRAHRGGGDRPGPANLERAGLDRWDAGAPESRDPGRRAFPHSGLPRALRCPERRGRDAGLRTGSGVPRGLLVPVFSAFRATLHPCPSPVCYPVYICQHLLSTQVRTFMTTEPCPSLPHFGHLLPAALCSCLSTCLTSHRAVSRLRRGAVFLPISSCSTQHTPRKHTQHAKELAV